MQATSTVQITGVPDEFEWTFEETEVGEGIGVYTLKLQSEAAALLQPVRIKWRFPAHNVKGVWSTNALHEKRLTADWESPNVESRVSVDAPVLCVYGHEDENLQTFACSDAIHKVVLAAPVREEDNFIHCQICLFSEAMPLTNYYETQIRIDSGEKNFGRALQEVSQWWESFPQLKPLPTPADARLPLYSSWYSYHQSVSPEGLLEECKQSSKMGYKLIIVDDGWQTLDNNRGYDYTGDWKAERFTEMKAFVDQVHQLGMKAMIWYSVPFCGEKSKAFQRFKGKFLTENHRWAPVFDPRYPEVREYLVNTYVAAMKNWGLDGFKLDFIDDFKVYPETVLTKENGRDFASVNEAVDCLMSSVASALLAINPEVLIEFRQKYIGPAMRKYGNMFRAFDAPNDSLSNRIRITDVKLLCGQTAVHSDMFAWHYDEPVEIAALQISSILFSVPQLSVRLGELTAAHQKMIRFYTQYWLSRQKILLDGHFTAWRPSANYPLLSSALGNHIVYGLYEDFVLPLDNGFTKIDLINGKRSAQIIVRSEGALGLCELKIVDCMGQLILEEKRELEAGLHQFEVPSSGLIFICKA